MFESPALAELCRLSLIPARKNGQYHPGARLEIFDAGTTSRRQAYADAGLTAPLAQPILADADALFPVVFVGGGTDYRCRVTTPGGALIRDVDGITVASAPASGGGGGGGTGGFGLQTGDVFWAYRTGSRAGCVRVNGRSIGSAASGASERANADCYSLFVHLWDADPTLAVSGGRGATADADWTANKPLTLPDLCGGVPVGLDDMGGAAKGRLAGALFVTGTATTLGARLGAATHRLTEAELAVHYHLNTASTTVNAAAAFGASGPANVSGSVAVTGYETQPTFVSVQLTPGSISYSLCTGGQSIPMTSTGTNSMSGSASVTVPAHGHTASTTLTNANAGSGRAHNNVQPGVLGTYYMVL